LVRNEVRISDACLIDHDEVASRPAVIIERSHVMRTIAVALVTAAMLNAAPALAGADAAPARTPHEGMASAHPAREREEHRPHGHHRHRITTIVVYVPALGVPYYSYAPPTSGYVDQDPPEYAYRDLSGFYYWCPDPPAYFPDQQDCLIGWRLVAP
jgi:hypothetical protein